MNKKHTIKKDGKWTIISPILSTKEANEIWEKGVKKGAKVGDKVIATYDGNGKIVKIEVEKHGKKVK